MPVQLDPRKIVNGIAAALNESKNAIKPAIGSGDSERGARLKAEVSQANDVGEIKTAEAFVVGDIHENGIWLNWRRHACSSC